MGTYQIGEVIRLLRKEKGITQELLSDGLCSVETLSRIENGKHTPSRATLDALMERLGKDSQKFFP